MEKDDKDKTAKRSRLPCRLVCKNCGSREMYLARSYGTMCEEVACPKCKHKGKVGALAPEWSAI